MGFLTDSEFSELCSFMQINYGLDLHTQRAYSDARIQSMMTEYGYTAFPEFFEAVLSDLTGNSISDLVSSLTVNYSLFYREAIHFEFLKNKVLPELEKRYGDTADLRIWSAGCATGEEPYTIAMILADYFGWRKPQWDTTILATDISTVALSKAIRASYNKMSTQNLDESWIRSYFVPSEDNSLDLCVNETIRKEVLFRHHNLAQSPFHFKKKFHLIFCRNVMIYFNDEGRKKLLRRFYDVLEDGGYLFIGLSESIDREFLSPFEYVMPSVFRKGGAKK